MRILFLSTAGNSCRSIMAEAFLQNMDSSLEVYSACLSPEDSLNSMIFEVMKEAGIDISNRKLNSFHEFEDIYSDYVISLCDGTRDKILNVNIPCKHKIHLAFDDPPKGNCAKEQLIESYREIRDEIKNELEYFYNRILIPELIH